MTSSSPPIDPPIRLRQVTYLHTGDRGIDAIDLDVRPGSIQALLGPNGSGKSTILSIVSGFRDAQAGEVAVLGAAVTPQLRRRIGILFQESTLDDLMTVRETLWLHGRLFGMGGRDLKQRLNELLEVIGLADRSGDSVETLSGGMKRRLELARAVLHRPDLVLLDEPTLGLDPDSKARLWQMLLDINRHGATILVATNDVSEAERYSTQVAFLERGHIIAQGTPANLKRDLRHDSVRVDWPQAPADIERTVAAWEGVGRVIATPAANPTMLHATVDNASLFVPDLFKIANGAIQGIRIHESTLEDAYFQLVGASVNGDGAAFADNPLQDSTATDHAPAIAPTEPTP
jgi:ABC-2 type transport system ATP-binding protein